MVGCNPSLCTVELSILQQKWQLRGAMSFLFLCVHSWYLTFMFITTFLKVHLVREGFHPSGPSPIVRFQLVLCFSLCSNRRFYWQRFHPNLQRFPTEVSLWTSFDCYILTVALVFRASILFIFNFQTIKSFIDVVRYELNDLGV